MSDFVKSPEFVFAVLTVAAILFFTVRAVAKSGRAARTADGGGGGLYPYGADAGSGDCGGDGGGGD